MRLTLWVLCCYLIFSFFLPGQNILFDAFKKWLPHYGNKIKYVGPNYVPVPGITFTSTPGHTFHHMSIVVRSREKTLFIAGDMVMGKVRLNTLPSFSVIHPFESSL